MGHRIVLAAAALLGVVFIAAVFARAGLGERQAPAARAHSEPDSCVPVFVLALAAPTPAPPIVAGAQVQIAIGGYNVPLPTPTSSGLAGPACTAFDVDFEVDVPPIEGTFQPVCTISSIAESAQVYCPSTVAYTADPAHRDASGNFRVDTRVTASWHDSPSDCVDCFIVTQSSYFFMSLPVGGDVREPEAAVLPASSDDRGRPLSAAIAVVAIIAVGAVLAWARGGAAHAEVISADRE